MSRLQYPFIVLAAIGLILSLIVRGVNKMNKLIIHAVCEF